MPDSVSNPRLRCVHCHTTETPLWRTGPDGPRSLCNACGVRFKKGKLVLYKDEHGNLTAVKREDSLPVHVPPPTKKPNKRAVSNSTSHITPTSPVDSSINTPANLTAPSASSKRVVRKIPSESALQQNISVLSKKPRARARRVNAGQLPGRYASSQFSTDSHHSLRSPTDSPASSPSSPAHSPRVSADRSTTLTASSSFVTDDFPPHHRNSLSDEDHLFTDMASLGLDASADPENHTLLPMPADPCSAEQFTFAFSGLGRDAYLAFDAPDRVGALRALLLDRTRNVAQRYDSTLLALCRLYEYRQQHHCDRTPGTSVIMNGGSAGTSSCSSQGCANVDDCKEFVRSFAQMDLSCGVDNPPFIDSETLDQNFSSDKNVDYNQSTLMLAEKTLHSAAVEKMRDLVDSSELFGFAETCLIELLAEDFSIATNRRFFIDYEQSNGRFRQVADIKLAQHKAVAAPA